MSYRTKYFKTVSMQSILEKKLNAGKAFTAQQIADIGFANPYSAIHQAQKKMQINKIVVVKKNRAFKVYAKATKKAR